MWTDAWIWSGPAAVAVCFVLSADIAGARGVGVVAPQYESPGGTVPVVVTAYGVPAGYRATITARATGGATVMCAGSAWHNRLRRTASRKCYLRLPARRGAHQVLGRAVLRSTGRAVVVRRGVGSRPVLANGHRSPAPMPLRRMQAIERCFNDTEEVWLTFDDGGTTAQVSRILRILRRNDVRGRFFFTGAWAASHRRLLGQMRREGHVIANHSFTHPALSKASAGEVARQIRNGTRATTRPGLLRPPFGAGALTTRLETLSARQGYRLCRWTVDTYDWQGASAQRMAERIRVGDELTPPVEPGGNILMHGTAPHTSAGLERIIGAVRSRGLALEPLP